MPAGHGTVYSTVRLQTDKYTAVSSANYTGEGRYADPSFEFGSMGRVSTIVPGSVSSYSTTCTEVSAHSI